jgi:redox-sensing transcriptional repressor
MTLFMRKISESTVGRLSLYLRILREYEGGRTISSEELAGEAGTSAAQVRKDLSLFGTFGKRGLGYSVPELIGELRAILGLEGEWRVALVGAGRIGQALFGYQDFRTQGFYIRAVFDSDRQKVGQRWNGTEVRHDADLERVLAEEAIDIVIVAVPAAAAQGVVDRVVAGGVRAILNFAPTRIEVPAGVTLKNVNMAVELEGLSYALANERPEGGRARAG